ncbi:MAG: insulinase family protein [Flavobacteriales bacterium]|jgi:predicted Zn-dependent peptidase|nr:insulinase family protein [Flavobacteriales bacterium]
MKSMKVLASAILVASLVACNDSGDNNTSQAKKETPVMEHKDQSGFSYETYANDPTGLRLYTLKNGFKVYLSQNFDEPKIQTYIAVRAGSNYDPKESTGLAHYLEHMVFKGTSNIGTVNWEEEKVLLKQISDLYEKHKATSDPKEKEKIYKEIDKISLKASHHSVANEYDKMVSSLGATGTNAHTWFEETIYKNKIPANELKKWLHLEKERFSELVLRLFHTELEAVYEEFNRGQDNDWRKSYAAMLEGLFPKHPYGQQTTIGTSEHLKNPSMVAIHNYFNKYYVPNNMAMVLVGDFNFDETIKEIDATFGALKSKKVEHPVLPKEDPITEPIIKEVYGPTAENITIAFRSEGIGSADEKLLTMADMILANGQAGLIDLNLNQQQAVLNAGCSPTFLNDYGYHSFRGSPKQGQSLDEVKELLMAQIEKLKKGEFEDWMMGAVINDLKLSETRQYEKSTPRASAYYNAFIHRENWADKVKFIDDLKKITKEELVAFANKFYGNNYVVTYKRKGEDKTVAKVKNPGITPVKLNRDKKSNFLGNFNKMESGSIQPKFIDFEKELKTFKKDGLEITHIENKLNDLCDLYFIFDFGKENNKKLSLAANYMDYLGTDKLSSEDLKKEFYKIGMSPYIYASEDRVIMGLTGLKDNIAKGVELMENLWTNAKADQTAYNKMIAATAKSRENTKSSKGAILRNGLYSYAMYGKSSPLRDIYSIEELGSIKPQELIDIIKELKIYKHRVFYYGKDINNVKNAIAQYHKIPSDLKDYTPAKKYEKQETGNQVYFVDYDMVQAEMMFLAKSKPFDVNNMAKAYLFNTYFGSGLSSIIFQEIRESKSLAYSAYARYSSAREKEEPNYVHAYIGTQANKLEQAVNAMMELMNDMPMAQEQFDAAKNSALKKIAAERITKTNIFWNYEGLKKRGLKHDIRKDMYETIKNMSIDDLKVFFDNNIKGESYNVMLLGNKKDLDMKAISKLGKVTELNVDHLFNYN